MSETIDDQRVDDKARGISERNGAHSLDSEMPDSMLMKNVVRPRNAGPGIW